MNQIDSIRLVRGVGEKAQKALSKLDIYDVGDLLKHYPRSYDAFEDIKPIAELKEGEISAIGGTISFTPKLTTKGRLKILSVTLDDGTSQIDVTWFNMPFLKKKLRMGTYYIFRGRMVRYKGRLTMQQPKIYDRGEFYNLVGKLLPIYPLTSGITNNAMTKYIKEALLKADDILEYMPKDIRDDAKLIGYRQALRQIHFPESIKGQKEGRKRLVFDELFLYTMAIKLIKAHSDIHSDHIINKHKKVDEFISLLPYDLTNAQYRTYEEIMTDLSSGKVMNRLIQGDVGSGKTIVAVLSLYQTVAEGYQGALMVPTEVLARQHYNLFKSLLKKVRIGLLTGSMSAKEKKEVKQKIAVGEYDIVIGTHAIIQDDVKFLDLALVVTDEQHRFGVKQREEFSTKGDQAHVLAMSATPIPRTLALILYGDMDLSVIDEKPASRLPIKNAVVNTYYRQNAYRFIQKQIDSGHQAYVICPMVDESDTTDLENVTYYTEELVEYFPQTVRIQGLHGRMKPSKKDEIMTAFAKGDIDILVSTTVIEVGIDVPNATVMLIENAERFGLATLHQLRGRIGRGDAQSYCIFMSGVDTKEAKERLMVLGQSNDGFYIANEDLKQRGQGDLFGIRQSGEKLFKLADIYEDADILKKAGECAASLSESVLINMVDKNPRLKSQVDRYMGPVTL